jgi:hypothetical protein
MGEGLEISPEELWSNMKGRKSYADFSQNAADVALLSRAARPLIRNWQSEEVSLKPHRPR